MPRLMILAGTPALHTRFAESATDFDQATRHPWRTRRNSMNSKKTAELPLHHETLVSKLAWE